MNVPGIAPITSGAMVAAIGARDALSKGRDFAAWLGLVPDETSCDARPEKTRKVARADERPY